MDGLVRDAMVILAVVVASVLVAVLRATYKAVKDYLMVMMVVLGLTACKLTYQVVRGLCGIRVTYWSREAPPPIGHGLPIGTPGPDPKETTPKDEKSLETHRPSDCTYVNTLHDVGVQSCLPDLTARDIGVQTHACNLMAREVGVQTQVQELVAREVGVQTQVQELVARDVGRQAHAQDLMMHAYRRPYCHALPLFIPIAVPIPIAMPIPIATLPPSDSGQLTLSPLTTYKPPTIKHCLQILSIPSQFYHTHVL